jgi:CubicO group peptidase (beta-lactamase class C family)
VRATRALATRLAGFGLVVSACAVSNGAAAGSVGPAEQITGGLETTYYIAGAARPRYTLAERMRRYRVPAVSIAVMDDYALVWSYATGLRDVASNAPASTATLFQAASMSKPVAAAGILALFEAKHLDLDADVNTMLRSWHVPPPPGNSSERVTMRRLLSHTAGINVHGFAGYDRDAPLPTLVQVLDGAPPANNAAIRVVAVPGSATAYSGGGTSIAQQLAVDVSGEPFPVFMQQRLAKLGMTSSTFDQPLPEALWPRAADGYYGDGRPVHRGWHVYPTMAAAGLWTTPSDLAAFVIAIQNALRGRGEAPVDATVAREMTTRASEGFGLGLGILPGYFSHSGANVGFQGIFIGLNEGGRGVVVMTNSDNGLLLADEIVHSVARTYDWPILQPQPKTSIPLGRPAMEALVGKYAAKFDGESVTLAVTTRQSDGAPALFLRSSLDGFESRLYAERSSRFFTLGGASLQFVSGADGRVRAVRAAGVTFERLP